MSETFPAWHEVDRALTGWLVADDPALAATLARNHAAGLPPHDVSPLQGKFLQLIARMIGARRILEIGTLGGYSTIWLARALPEGGRLVTLEAAPRHAATARANLAAAGLAERVTLHEGPALDSLARLAAGAEAPFDLVFIDADKPNNPAYLDWALKLVHPGSVIIGDNVVRDGAVAGPADPDPRVRGVRDFLAAMGRSPQLSATALQTVGEKGWDGFAIALVE